MSFAGKVKELLKKNGMTKAELAKDAGIAYTTLDSMLKRETDTERLAVAFRIAKALGTSVEELVFEEDDKKGVSPEEERILKLYALLDARGKDTVLSLLEKEADISKSTLIRIPLYDAPAAAGEPLPVLTEENGFIEGTREKIPQKASFAIRISGDSMEPLLSNGDPVYVERVSELMPGQIGIFLLNGESLCKRLAEEDGKKLLVSVNPAYPPITILDTDDLRLVGRVIAPENESEEEI
ncbi:MAG: helix-turn-helix domain-containing protein [Ruminococcaceae bacterium]|nr:helix-turn-helix domain-containing protein [Oscillospiraceae bacterium]